MLPFIYGKSCEFTNETAQYNSIFIPTPFCLKLQMKHASILKKFSISALNEMQKSALEAVSKPNDVMLIAPTGSGKTLAFLLPVLDLLDKEQEQVQVLIVVPSRELALQIEQVFKQMGTYFKINACYG